MEKKKTFRSSIPDPSETVSIINANPLQRVIAFAIDFTIIQVSVLLILILLGNMGLVSRMLVFEIYNFRTNIYDPLAYFTSLEDIFIHIGISAYFLIYFIVPESKYVWGKTIGKRVIGIEVLDSNADKVGLKASFLRNSTKYFLRVPVIGIPFGMIELILIFLYSSRTGDILTDASVASAYHRGSFTDVKEGEENLSSK
ncbi:MAG: RDD family protein [Candidatus Thermoplasmatota archaeon]|nr:RDD family protein [Candidatus Thermoplasmatota archaeon]